MKKRPRFLLAGNLNKLAKWLRILGYDAATYKSISFENMIRIAVKDKRIILTRCKKQAKSKKKFKRILIISDIPKLQLIELKELIEYDEAHIFSRCGKCNKILYKIEREKIQKKIPKFVFEQHLP